MNNNWPQAPTHWQCMCCAWKGSTPADWKCPSCGQTGEFIAIEPDDNVDRTEHDNRGDN